MKERKIENFSTIFFSLVFLLFFTGCGLKEYYYLPPVPINNIDVESNNRVTIQLPNISSTEYPYFENGGKFIIYYRIYISDAPLIDRIIDDQQMGEINQTLKNSYNQLLYLTDTTSTTVNTNDLGKKFTDGPHFFYELELEDAKIYSVMESGKKLVIEFSRIPHMEIDTQSYNLFRSTGEGSFLPEPDRYFRNTVELCDSANVTEEKNADVADKKDIQLSPRYTYTMMYIVVTGFHPTDLNTIYSIPTFIGIFRLPEL